MALDLEWATQPSNWIFSGPLERGICEKIGVDTAEMIKYMYSLSYLLLRIYPLHLAKLFAEVAAKTAAADTKEERIENA